MALAVPQGDPMTSILFSRSRRTASIRSGRAGGLAGELAKMPLAEHDNVVKTFPPDRTDRPFTISVLPRRSRRRLAIPNPHRPKAAVRGHHRRRHGHE